MEKTQLPRGRGKAAKTTAEACPLAEEVPVASPDAATLTAGTAVMAEPEEPDLGLCASEANCPTLAVSVAAALDATPLDRVPSPETTAAAGMLAEWGVSHQGDSQALTIEDLQANEASLADIEEAQQIEQAEREQRDKEAEEAMAAVQAAAAEVHAAAEQAKAEAAAAEAEALAAEAAAAAEVARAKAVKDAVAQLEEIRDARAAHHAVQSKEQRKLKARQKAAVKAKALEEVRYIDKVLTAKQRRLTAGDEDEEEEDPGLASDVDDDPPAPVSELHLKARKALSQETERRKKGENLAAQMVASAYELGKMASSSSSKKVVRAKVVSQLSPHQQQQVRKRKRDSDSDSDNESDDDDDGSGDDDDFRPAGAQDSDSDSDSDSDEYEDEDSDEELGSSSRGKGAKAPRRIATSKSGGKANSKGPAEIDEEVNAEWVQALITRGTRGMLIKERSGWCIDTDKECIRLNMTTVQAMYSRMAKIVSPTRQAKGGTLNLRTIQQYANAWFNMLAYKNDSYNDLASLYKWSTTFRSANPMLRSDRQAMADFVAFHLYPPLKEKQVLLPTDGTEHKHLTTWIGSLAILGILLAQS